MTNSERTPLLGPSQNGRPQSSAASSETQDGSISESQIGLDSKEMTPVPKMQLAILCLLRPLDPMSFTQIFPYINSYILSLGVTDDLSQVAFYSGIAESAYAATQLLSIYPWGYFSDRFGRRPVILIGTAGLAISTMLFGLATNFKWMLIFRVLAGLFSGNVPVVPTILIEITDKTNQAFAFSFFGVWWPVGAVIGPLVGGLLSEPAKRYPKIFKHPIWMQHPYWLPGLFVSIVAALVFVLSWVYLEETLNRHKPKIVDESPEVDGGQSSREGPNTRYTAWEVWQIPSIRALCTSALVLSFLATGFDVLFVLFCFMPIKQGGLGLPISQIGFALATAGTAAGTLQAFFMPTFLRRYNHARFYHFCMKIWPYSFASLPLLNLIARTGNPDRNGTLDSHTLALIWAGIIVILTMSRIAYLCFSLNMLLVKAYSPSPSALGSVMGLLQLSIYSARAVGPTLCSGLFSLSSNQQGLVQYSWAIVMVVIGFTSSLVSRQVIKESARLGLA